ncbi:MAG: VOC family protein [Acholeplasmataceae bacterium]|nr:VOC family protein [Acholeplasmataceae bacterium]
MKKLNGIHHVTAITSSAEKIYDFFTNILGLRLVKKTINQDDINTYHLFFADDIGSAGTDMTFFDFNGASQAIKGTNEIAKTSFRVPTNQAIDYWKKRFEKYEVTHFEIKEMFGRKTLEFRDFDDAEYVLFSDESIKGIDSGIPWQKGPVPNEFGITGLGPIFFRVNNLELMNSVLTNQLFFDQISKENSYILYETGLGGNGAAVIVEYRPDLAVARQGYGGIHHVAFRVDEKTDLDDWISVLNKIGAPHSGHVDRFYFKSLYTRLYPGMLFEFATEGPGFIDDEEDYETLGETLALPPKFRGMREKIEKLVRHIETKRSDKVYNKEYID